MSASSSCRILLLGSAAAGEVAADVAGGGAAERCVLGLLALMATSSVGSLRANSTFLSDEFLVAAADGAAAGDARALQ